MPSADRTDLRDVRDLLEAASRTSPREPDPVAAVARRHARAPRLLAAPGTHRRSALLAAATVVAVAAGAAVVAVAVSAGPSGGERPVAGPASSPAATSLSPSMAEPLPGPLAPPDPATELASQVAGSPWDLDVAHTLLVDECAAAQGVDVARPPFAARRVPQRFGLLALWLGDVPRPGAVVTAVDLGELPPASQRAYGRASDGADPQEVTFSLAGGGSLSRPVSGCFGQATAELYGVPAVDHETAAAGVRDLDERVRAEVRADPAVVAALPAWSACLGGAGLQVEGTDGSAAPSSPEELDALAAQLERDGADLGPLAEAESRCRTTSGLGEVARAAVASAEAGLSASDRASLDAWGASQGHAQTVVQQRAQAEGGAWAALVS